MKQPLGLEDDSKQYQTPATSPSPQNYEEPAPFKEKWSYRSLICMLTYLARNTFPNFEYVVHQYDRFQCNPRELCANAIKRIGRYLSGTKDKDISFKPTKNLSHFECYVDVTFDGNYTSQTLSSLEHDV